MTGKRVSILSHDLAGNALSRAYTLAKLLQPEYKVHVVGFGKPDDLWAPSNRCSIVPYASSPRCFAASRESVARVLIARSLNVASAPKSYW